MRCRPVMAPALPLPLPLPLPLKNISAKSKLSQNRDPVDFDGVSREMEMTGRKTLSAGMKRLRGNADQELRHA
ncbi:MAG: hypothetical protein VXZ67_00265 [Pseudomonadota bacterium]|nr:hypothetical protein [Pseudomonadota bacterium]